MARKFYIDMDDTLANFREHAIACGVPPWSGTWYATDPATWTPEQHEIQRHTNEIMEDANFWMNMPVIAGSFDMLAACATRGETYLLTAYPRTCPDKPMVARCKVAWAEMMLHFPGERVIVCERAEKIKYATTGVMDDDGAWDPLARPNILIDDADKNCEEWRGAGGVALHYRGDFREIIDAVKHMHGAKR